MEEAEVSLAARHPSIEWSVRRFEFLMDTSRTIRNELDPKLSELSSKYLEANLSGALEGLSLEASSEFFSYLTEVFDNATPNEDAEGTVQLSFDGGRLYSILGDRHLANEAFRSLQELGRSPNPAVIFRNSMLTQAIGGFELLVSSIMTRRYVDHPEILNEDESVFSLSDLRSFEDITEATDYLINRRVSNDMRGDGLAGWSKWFLQQVGTRLSEIASDYDAICEAWQRRHIIVHNGGRVSRRYLEMIPKSCERPQIGTHLSADQDYLADITSQIDCLGTILATKCQKKWKSAEEDRLARHHLQRSYELMRQDEWYSACLIAETGLQLKSRSQTQNSLTANYLTCIRHTSGIEEAKSRAEDWDTSGAKDIYEVVRQVLLGNVEQILQAVPDLVARAIVSPGELRAWPVFETVRELDGFEKTLADVDS